MNIVKVTGGIFLAMLIVASAAYAREARAETRPQTESVDGKQAYGQLLLEAEALVKSGKPADAYAVLELLEFEHSGEERFDYLIGIAALDSGRADKATLAFERVLMVNPDSAAARLDMARAYYQLGDFSRAQTEFATSLKQNPSEAARANIEKYLDDIAAREAGKQTSYSGYVAVTAGQDSNVNNSTGQSQVFVDAIATKITLDPSNLKTSDSYYGLATGGEIMNSLNSRWGLYAGADLRQRANSTQKNFDAFSVDARLGAMLVTQAHRVRIGVSDGQYSLGNAHNSDAVGINAEWSRVFSPSNQLKVFGQYAQYRFVDATMQVNDYDQQAVGGGWFHVLKDGQSTLSGSLYYGTEKDISTLVTATLPNGGRADGAKRFNGLRIGGQTAFNDRITLYANAGGQIGDYSKTNYYFQRQRSDRMYDLAIGANWRWDKLWIFRPQLNYSENNSNIVIYSYDRTDFSLTIRRDFR